MDPDPYGSIKIEYHDPTDTGRVVSQTFSKGQTRDEPLKKVRKILSHVMENSNGANLPRITIKRETADEREGGEVILLNNGWPPMDDVHQQHNPELLGSYQHQPEPQFFAGIKGGGGERMTVVSPSPRGSDSGIESDFDGNLSWLLNYKIRELPPVPDSAPTDLENGGLFKESKSTTGAGSKAQAPASEVVIGESYKTSSQPAVSNAQKKPPFTYTELIEHALSEQGELTVSGIYNWISNHFPFYKANDDRWKNSVRHNLSINPHFRKGGKAAHGAGHLWTIAQRDETKSWQMRQRINDFLRTFNAQLQQQEHTQKLQQDKPEQEQQQDALDKELQAATQSILEEIHGHTQIESIGHHQNGPDNERQNDENVHVEFINLPEGVTGLEGFLSPPVSKQDIVNECGLGSDFFITDINPNQLGLNLVEAEAGDDKMYEEMSLEYYGLK